MDTPQALSGPKKPTWVSPCVNREQLEATTLAQEALAAGPTSLNYAIRLILAHASSHFSVSHDDIISRRRYMTVAWARQVAMYCARKLLGTPYKELGRQFRRDHVTIIYAVKRVEDSIYVYSRVRNDTQRLLEKVKTDLERCRWPMPERKTGS